MHNELTNLLPQERQQMLTHGYYYRLAVVAASLISVLVIVAGVLLLPSYVFLVMNENVKKGQLSTIESSMSSAEEKSLSLRLSVLSGNAATLVALEHVPSASMMIRNVLALSRVGIVLSGISYTTADAENSGALIVTGIAATRDALRNYQLAVESAAFVRSADLPVSAYAKDSRIPFSIAITLAP